MSGWLKELRLMTTSSVWKNNYTFRITHTYNSLVARPTFAPARQAVPARILLRWQFHSLSFQELDCHQRYALLFRARPAHRIGIIITFRKKKPDDRGMSERVLCFMFYFIFGFVAAVVWLDRSIALNCFFFPSSSLLTSMAFIYQTQLSWLETFFYCLLRLWRMPCLLSFS